MTPGTRPPGFLNAAQAHVLRHLLKADGQVTIPEHLDVRSGDLYLLYATRLVERTLKHSGDHTYAITERGREALKRLDIQPRNPAC